MRKKIAVGLEKTAKIDTKTWSSALSGARNIRVSNTPVVLGLSNDPPISGARPTAIPPSSTKDVTVIAPTAIRIAPNMRA